MSAVACDWEIRPMRRAVAGCQTHGTSSKVHKRSRACWPYAVCLSPRGTRTRQVLPVYSPPHHPLPRTKCGGSTHRECRTPALASLFLGKTGEPGIHETSGAVERCNSCTPILQSGQILHRGRAGVTPHPRKLPREVSRRMLNGEHLWPLRVGIRRYCIRTRAIRPRPGNTSTPGPSLRQRRQ